MLNVELLRRIFCATIQSSIFNVQTSTFKLQFNVFYNNIFPNYVGRFGKLHYLCSRIRRTIMKTLPKEMNDTVFQNGKLLELVFTKSFPKQIT